MTIEEAKAKGYEVVAASAIEIGLVRNGQGMRTWWASDFGGELPPLDHPTIQACIQLCEDNDL